MSKKIIIVTTAVLILAVLTLGGYYFFFLRNSGGNQESETNSGFNGLFDFGNSGGNQSAGTTTPANEVSKNFDYLKKLRKISSEPVSGAGFSSDKAGFQTVRYIEKATGHIFESELSGPSSERLSNVTLPRVYDAVWSFDGKSVLARYLKDDDFSVDTYSLKLQNNSAANSTTNIASSSEIKAVAFPSNIIDLSALGNSVFYLYKDGGKSVGIVTDFEGKNKKQIWNSPVYEILAQLVNEKTVALVTKPEVGVNGYLYFVNTSNGLVTKILGDIVNLTGLVSPDGKNVLAGSGSYNFYNYNISDKSTEILSPSTFPEKCVWSRKDSNIIYCAAPTESLSGISLISWYKGLTSFSDRIWKYDTKNNSSSIVEDLINDTDESIDAIKPILSPDERFIVFINKKDGSLWSVDLSK